MDGVAGVQHQVFQSMLGEVKATIDDPANRANACVICLESIAEPATALPCRHNYFDFLCLLSWLQERSTCPLCKTSVRSVEYDQKSDQDFEIYNVPTNIQAHASSVSCSVRPLPSTPHPGRAHSSLTARNPRPSAPVSADAALLRRKHIYRSQLYSFYVGSSRLSRFRELTPALFTHDEELVSRARKWIRRELQVFEFLHAAPSENINLHRRASNADFLLEYIVAILKTVHMKGSGGQAEDMLQEFFGRKNTTLFLHELKAWLRSPYTSLQDWDRNVQYNETPYLRGPTEAQAEARGYKNEERGMIQLKAPCGKRRQRRIDRYVPYYSDYDRRVRNGSRRNLGRVKEI